jgi:hypothetical protein
MIYFLFQFRVEKMLNVLSSWCAGTAGIRGWEVEDAASGHHGGSYSYVRV